MKLLIASGNQGKIAEIKDFLQELDLKFVGLKDLAPLPEVVEDGDTFEENARKKAHRRAKETGLLTLADDSGLVVDYLNGAPGVYSARYAGVDATDEENYLKLLKELEGVPGDKRTARFKAVMVMFNPATDKEIVVTGSCEGIIIDKPRGNNGFGYDPVFYLEEYGKTMAELPMEVKNTISHRANALKKLSEIINNNSNIFR